MTTTLLSLILYYSGMYNVNPMLVVAVIEHESNYNQYATGKVANERGYMQLNPKSFPEYKPDQLYNSEINIREGVKYLAKMKKECKHKLDNDFITCYNLGIKKGNKVRYPKLWKYNLAVNKIMQNKFKEGDKVIVEGLFNLRSDGPGTYRREITEGPNKGKLLIENEYYHMMAIHPDRVKKAE